MKLLNTLLSTVLCAVLSTSSWADQWLTGTYVNKEQGRLMEEITFCQQGRAYIDYGRQTYWLEERDNERFLVLSANGIFTFKVSDDNSMLTPANPFTREWASRIGFSTQFDQPRACH